MDCRESWAVLKHGPHAFSIPKIPIWKLRMGDFLSSNYSLNPMRIFCNSFSILSGPGLESQTEWLAVLVCPSLSQF